MANSQNQGNGSSPFTSSPSPWRDMKADIFCSLGYASKGQGLPPAAYAPLESDSNFANPTQSGKYVGGLGMCMIVRYTKTPVGPYDEVLWVPGSFEAPPTGKKQPRISRIFVSSLESVYNGRKNWNIPKQLANFKFEPSDSSSLPYKRIEVSLPNTQDPFISLDLKPIWLLSRPLLPISTSYSPINLDLAMPPLPQAQTWHEDGRVGTPDEKWHVSRVGISGRAGILNMHGSLGNGSEFPRLPADGVWFWVQDATMEFVTVDNEYGLA